MSRLPLFAGLIIDESQRPVETAQVGDEATYVIDDAGFLRHVDAEKIDRQVLLILREQILANRDMVTEGALQMLGSDDLFTKAMIDSSISNIDQHLDRVIEQGLPTEARQWLGMLGFRVIVDYRGEVIGLDQPGVESPDED